MSKHRGKRALSCLELFAGGGGFALAAADAGFRTAALVERDPHACKTLIHNFEGNSKHQAHVIETDVNKLAPEQFTDVHDLLLGGPPCQPFSLGGNGLGHQDSRDMIPAFANFVRTLQPRAFVIENVVGLLRPKFKGYLTRTLALLSSPMRPGRPPAIDLVDGRVVFKNGKSGLRYRIHFRVLNAADYGVPQLRQRLFIVGIRDDQGFDWNWPTQTHSREALLADQFLTRRYFARHDIRSSKYQGSLTSLRDKLERSSKTSLKPHLTVRDGIGDLPDPQDQQSKFSQHIYVPGARSYEGHTGSPWDLPAKTVKAGVHSCPGGENMLRMSRGVRYFTIRELARLQSFPDDYEFLGMRIQCIRQLGNAVPVKLGQAILNQLRTQLAQPVANQRHDAAQSSLSSHI